MNVRSRPVRKIAKPHPKLKLSPESNKIYEFIIGKMRIHDSGKLNNRGELDSNTNIEDILDLLIDGQKASDDLNPGTKQVLGAGSKSNTLSDHIHNKAALKHLNLLRAKKGRKSVTATQRGKRHFKWESIRKFLKKGYPQKRAFLVPGKSNF